MRCCQGGLCGLLNNVLQIGAKRQDPADDFKDEKRREKKKDRLYQEAMTIALFAAAWTELRGAKSEVDVTGPELVRWWSSVNHSDNETWLLLFQRRMSPYSTVLTRQQSDTTMDRKILHKT